MRKDYILHPTPNYCEIVYVWSDRKHKIAKLLVCNRKRFNRHRKGCASYEGYN